MNTDPTASEKTPLIILFDGNCGLCEVMVNFLLKRDPANRFRFSPQQSQTARDLMTQHKLDPETIESVVLIDGERIYTKSSAALRIVLEMPEPWPLLAMLVFLPEWLRDDAYDFVARHRHQWFKPPDVCRSPSADERERFLS